MSAAVQMELAAARKEEENQTETHQQQILEFKASQLQVTTNLRTITE